MTRCIHCTRCIRMLREVAGKMELGATGRGENVEIGTYVGKSLESELSGNVIDVCPVGALTSRPFRFKARAWELQQHASVAPHDCVGPIVWTASVHLALNAVNAAIQEAVRAQYTGWYTDVVTQLPSVVDGKVTAPEGVGLGIELKSGLNDRPDAIVRKSGL